MSISQSQSSNVSNRFTIHSSKIPIVGIGASAGGLDALKVFFRRVPANTGMAFVLVPHLDPMHKSLMVEIIAHQTDMPVIQVDKRLKIQSNQIYIVEPNRNINIENNELISCEISKNSGLNLPINFFFRSLAMTRKEQAIGVILSGTMNDGAIGLRYIKEYGGLVIAQNPKTVQHKGMPQSAIDTGMVDLILSIEDIPDAIIKFIHHPCIDTNLAIENKDEFNQVLKIIRHSSNQDFRNYKRNTIIRRTERRMRFRQIERMADYVNILKEDPDEQSNLLKDLLIGVTGFFREEQVWNNVSTNILPALLFNMSDATPLRLWIPGCSTGQEVYTLAILIHEAFECSNKHFNAQIFASDIDVVAIETARKGIYPETIADSVPTYYLDKYFVKEGHEYRILKKIRESVVFAVQNLIGDPPFSNMNLISCRNLLIYLNPETQKKIIDLFYFSLKEKGYLILGNSETIGYQNNLFEIISKEFRIYRRIGQRIDRMQMPIMKYTDHSPKIKIDHKRKLSSNNISTFMQNQLLKRFSPAAVLVNRKFEILNLNGQTNLYIDLPQGDPIMDLANMVKEGLRLKLRSAMHKSAKNNETTTVMNARVKRDQHYYPVRFTVTPVKEKDMAETLFLITFEENQEQIPKTVAMTNIDVAEETLISQLETELTDVREELKNTVEELESYNEELRVSNEEMMSMNEELQSSNEELETSKEEMQSMNEELNTVNAELREKIQELEITNNDMANLMNSTDIATVFLDINMTIRRYTPSAKKLFSLITSDIGRPIGDLAIRFHDDGLKDDVSQVLQTLIPTSREVKTDNDHWFIRRILPFRTQDNRVDGLVLTFTDVTTLKQSEISLKQSESRLSAAVRISNVGIYEHNEPIGPELYCSEHWSDILGYKQEELPSYDIFFEWFMKQVHPDDISIFEKNYSDFIEGKTKHYESEIRMKKKTGEWIYVHSMSWAIARDKNNNATKVLGVTRDVTNYRQIESAIKENEQRFQAIFNTEILGIAISSHEKKWIEVNDVVCKMFGYSRQEFQDKTWLELTHPDDLDEELEQFNRMLSGIIKGYTIEKRFIRKDGSIVNTTLFVNSVRKPDSFLKYFVVLLADITERKQYETTLKQNERRLRQAQKMTRCGYWDWYVKNNQLVWSDDVYIIFDQDKTQFEVTVDNLEKAIHPEDFELYICERDKALEENRLIDIEHRIILPNGNIRYIHEIAEIIRDRKGDIVQVSGTVQDITERKIVEKQLIDSEKVLKITLDATTDGIWTWNFKTNEISFSPKFYTMLGYKPDEFPATYENWTNLIHPDDREKALKISKKYLKNKPDRYENEFRLKTKNNNYRWIRAKARVTERDEQNNAVFIVGNHEDITERNFMREKLELLTEAVDNSLAGFDIVNENQIIIYANKAYLSMWKYETIEDVIGTSLSNHCIDNSMPARIIEHVHKDGGGDFEFVAKARDGSTFDVYKRVSVITGIDGKKYYHGFSMDITERNTTAARLKEYAEEQKILVREIHHRVKNNLEVIISLIEMRAKAINDESLELIFNEIKERIWAIAYVHEDLYASENFLNINFESYLETLTHEICNLYTRSDIEIQTDFADIQLNIETAIPCGLVFIEMISNALKHAFPRDNSDRKNSRLSNIIQVGFFERQKTYTLFVNDNGKDFPDDIDWKNAKSMGLRLINILTNQLDGTLEIKTGKKTELKLSFPKKL